MPMISEAMLRDLKRGCWMYDCYKCRNAKHGAEECGDADSWQECQQDCACRTCDEGSNWAWACPVKPLTLEEVQGLEDGAIAWVETRDGIVRCMPAVWVKRGKTYTRKVRMALLQSNEEWVEEEHLVTADYGKTWRCWKDKPDKDTAGSAVWEETR